MEQFHEEKGVRKSVITLGRWIPEKHIEWLNQNPEKRPKKGKTPKMVSHFYGDGDVCAETGKPRHVEVKLKCKYSETNSDSVGLYLLEPQTCAYILGVSFCCKRCLRTVLTCSLFPLQVESPFLCRLLNAIDQNGLIEGRSMNDAQKDISTKEEL